MTSRSEAGVLYSLLSNWAGSGQLGEADVYSGRDVFVWLGGSDAVQEGRFRWVNTSADLTYTAWASGQPDGRWVLCGDVPCNMHCLAATVLAMWQGAMWHVICYGVPFLPFHHAMPPRRYGGEDCMAAAIRLGGSSGGGLRIVVSQEAQWYDMGCTAALPFVCQRKSLRRGTHAWQTKGVQPGLWATVVWCCRSNIYFKYSAHFAPPLPQSLAPSQAPALAAWALPASSWFRT